MMISIRARHALTACLLLAVFLLGDPVLAQPADLILHNGKIVTVDKSFTTAEAVAIRGARIVAVGDNATVLKDSGPDTQIIDLDGRTVVPGLIDTHLHMSTAALNRPAVKLLDARSVDDVKKLVAARVAQAAPGQWVVASSGWHESSLKEGRLPTRH